jgi:hypothetical protein
MMREHTDFALIYLFMMYTLEICSTSHRLPPNLVVLELEGNTADHISVYIAYSRPLWVLHNCFVYWYS